MERALFQEQAATREASRDPMPLTDILFSGAADPLGATGAPGSGGVGPGASLRPASPMLVRTPTAAEIAAGVPYASVSAEYVEPAGSGDFTLTAVGLDPGVFGMNDGPVSGSISPSSYNGQTVTALYVDTGAIENVTLKIVGSLAQGFFTTLTLNGTAMLSASAVSFFVSGGKTWWRWTVLNPFSSAGSYAGNFA